MLVLRVRVVVVVVLLFDDFHHRAVLVFDAVGLAHPTNLQAVDLLDCVFQGADFPTCQHFVIFDFGDDVHRSKVTELHPLSMFFSFTYLLGNREANTSVASVGLG